MLKPIRIDFVPQERQKYETVGNYGEEPDHIWFEITAMDNPMFSLAILLHEIYEFYRNQQLGITVKSVDEFDLGPVGSKLDDPGWHPDAPYRIPHSEATVIENAAIAMSGNFWPEYEAAIEALFD